MQTGFCAYKKLDFWIFCGLIALFGHLTLSGRHFSLLLHPRSSLLARSAKGHKKANHVRGGNLAEGLLAFRLADLCLGHVPQRCKSRLQRSMPCCILDQAYLLGPQKGIKKPIMFEMATWRKDCSPFGSRTFVWGMFPNDAKAACSVRCPVASSIKPTCSVRKRA